MDELENLLDPLEAQAREFIRDDIERRLSMVVPAQRKQIGVLQLCICATTYKARTLITELQASGMGEGRGAGRPESPDTVFDLNFRRFYEIIFARRAPLRNAKRRRRNSDVKAIPGRRAKARSNFNHFERPNEYQKLRAAWMARIDPARNKPLKVGSIDAASKRERAGDRGVDLPVLFFPSHS